MDNTQLQNLLLVANEQGSHIYVKAAGETFIRSFTAVVEKQILVAKKRGILISTLWSANALSRRLGLSQLPRGSLKVVDAVSLQLGSRIALTEDIVFLATPAAPESILVSLERMVTDRKGQYSFLILDSMTYLNRHFSRSQISDFFTYLLNRMLEEDITVIIFDQDATDQVGAAHDISALMDHSFDLQKEGA
jgi:hypothetical protein